MWAASGIVISVSLRPFFLIMAALLAVPAWAADGQNPTTLVTINIAPPPPPTVNDEQIGQLLGGLRLLPPVARRGTLQGGLPLPYVTLNDQQVLLTAGAIIYDWNNRTIVHGSVPPDKLDVVYTVDFTGQVNRIYILNWEERQRLEPWFKPK
jgi:hypothetical protein